jgi:hypothetical protein
MGNMFVACYQVGGEKTHIKEALEKSHDDFILASRCIRHEDILKK